ncbi:MAG: hypothetical protein U1F08_12240 [Steroidobacteraceae bacterium]
MTTPRGSVPGEDRPDDAAPEADAEWTCTGCGESNPAEFGLCWKCQASAPEPPAGAA